MEQLKLSLLININLLVLNIIGQDTDLSAIEKETCTKDNQLQLEKSNSDKRITNEKRDNNVQIHPELQIVEGEKHMPTEVTWQDMWPKNEKKQQEDDENGYGAECKEDTQEEIEEKALENEKERTWNDMWP